MPFQFRCGGCGAILYECEKMKMIRYLTTRNGRRVADAPITALIKHKIGEACPKCGKSLAKKPDKIDIMALEKMEPKT